MASSNHIYALLSCMKIGGKVESNPALIANSFNYRISRAVHRLTHFLGIAASLISILLSIFQVRRNHLAFTLTQLRKLKTRKSAGLDNMPGRLMKDAADIIAGPR